MSLVLLAAALSAPFDNVERITPQEAAKRVSQCGLGSVTVRYEPVLQDDLLIANEAKAATDEQLACADKAASYYNMELPPSVQARYDAIRKLRYSKLYQAEARDWLSVRGLLNKVPKYQTGVGNDATFTRQIESLCGPTAKGAFQSQFGFHALSPEWVKRELNPPDRGGEVLSCLLSATTVADFEVGFIGNEYYPSK